MKLVYILLLCLSANGAVLAQRTIFSVTYNVASPQTDLKEYIDRTSFRGFGLHYQYFLNSNLAVGGSFNLEVYNQKVDELFSVRGNLDTEGEGIGRSITADISGVQFRYFNTISFLFTTQYHFGKQWDTRLYAGLGLGPYRTLQRTEIGLVAITNNHWQLGLAPEIGVNIPLGLSDTGLKFGVRYNHAFRVGNSLEVSYLSFMLGIGFMY
ncbi:MAG: outer membrane beta-barrel protein [Cyclobacteriaceae bacterium]